MNALTFVLALVGMVFGFITYWIKLGLLKDDGKAPRRRHGRRRDRQREDYDLERLAAMADSLTERIDVLESILDAEVPNWREQHEQPS